jgi:hypothetical protein
VDPGTLDDGEASQADAGFDVVGSECPVGFVTVRGGKFMMGAPSTEPGFGLYGDDETQHLVMIGRAFCMKETEVTQGEWQRLMGNNPSVFYACGDDCPVEYVSWWDAVAYCNALSVSMGLPQCYSLTQCLGEPGTAGYTCAVVEFAGLDCTGFRPGFRVGR